MNSFTNSNRPRRVEPLHCCVPVASAEIVGDAKCFQLGIRGWNIRTEDPVVWLSGGFAAIPNAPTVPSARCTGWNGLESSCRSVAEPLRSGECINPNAIYSQTQEGFIWSPNPHGWDAGSRFASEQLSQPSETAGDE